MKRITILSVFLLSFCFVSKAEQIPEHLAKRIYNAVPNKPSVKSKKPRRVLIWNTPPHLMTKDPHKGYCIPYGEYALVAIGKKTGAFEPTVSDDISVFLPENITNFDAIVMNNSSGQWIVPADNDMTKDPFKRFNGNKTEAEQHLRNSFIEFIKNGGGIVVLHYAIAANSHWKEFAEILGGKFIGHPWNEEIGVTVEDPDNPLLSAFGGENFRIADEIYEYGDPYDRSKVRVLLSLDPARSNMGVKWIHRKDNDFALAWVKSFGKGRIFNTTFGHRTEIFWDSRILKFYLDAIQFATGDLVTPTEPGPEKPIRKIPGTDPVPGLPGFVSLFNGKDLDGWEGDRRIWRVENGVIVGETTDLIKISENNFLIWKDEIEDFELRVKFKIERGNSGIYFRSRKRSPGQTKGEPLVGMQADFSSDGRWTGVIMEYTLREQLAERGEKVVIETNGVKQVVGNLGDPEELLKVVKPDDWNEYWIVAKGGHIKISINGAPMCELDDRDPGRIQRGWLGLQVHTGPPMKVQFKDIFLRRLD